MATWQYYIEQHGEPSSVLKLRHVPKPVAGPGHVLVKIQASPVNPSDLMWIKGQYVRSPKSFPALVGFECAGEVEAVGDGVHNVKVGQRVSLFSDGGTWAEYTSVPASSVVQVPNTLAIELAAQLLINPLTVYGLLESGNLQPGDYVLQTAAGSSLGKLLIQFAKSKGYKTINVVRRKDQEKELKDLGADEVITTEEIPRVREITGGKGVKYAVDAVGGDGINELIKVLAYSGTIYVYGSLGGLATPNVRLLWGSNSKVGAWTLYNWIPAQTPEKLQAVYNEIIEGFISGKLKSPFQHFDAKTKILDALVEVVKPGRAKKPILV